MTVRLNHLPPHLAARILPAARPDMRAKGRLPSGTMNKTEARYDAHLWSLRMAGDVLWHRFDGIKLRIAPDCHLTVDFAVLPAGGVLEMHDVKGSLAIYTDDAKVKMKVAAAEYPFVFKLAVPRAVKDGGGWEIIDV